MRCTIQVFKSTGEWSLTSQITFKRGVEFYPPDMPIEDCVGYLQTKLPRDFAAAKENGDTLVIGWTRSNSKRFIMVKP